MPELPDDIICLIIDDCLPSFFSIQIFQPWDYIDGIQTALPIETHGIPHLTDLKLVSRSFYAKTSTAIVNHFVGRLVIDQLHFDRDEQVRAVVNHTNAIFNESGPLALMASRVRRLIRSDQSVVVRNEEFQRPAFGLLQLDRFPGLRTVRVETDDQYYSFSLKIVNLPDTLAGKHDYRLLDIFRSIALKSSSADGWPIPVFQSLLARGITLTWTYKVSVRGGKVQFLVDRTPSDSISIFNRTMLDDRHKGEEFDYDDPEGYTENDLLGIDLGHWGRKALENGAAIAVDLSFQQLSEKICDAISKKAYINH